MNITPLTLGESDSWAELLALSFDRSKADMCRLLGWLNNHYSLIAYGAWENTQLVAQYACLVLNVHLPDTMSTVKVGMSLNMSVHPDFRGRGLIKHVSLPVYEQLAAKGGIAGVGFSNAEGVKVDRNSKGYGYRVLGQMLPLLGWLKPHRKTTPRLILTDSLPDLTTLQIQSAQDHTHFAITPSSLVFRYAEHPFRRYRYAIWMEQECVLGVVVYRPVRLRGINGVALLGAYGIDTSELLRRWTFTIQQSLMHVLISPQSPLLSTLHQIAVCFRVPTRSPYFLTAKPLHESTHEALLDFTKWDCIGGDILRAYPRATCLDMIGRCERFYRSYGHLSATIGAGVYG